MATSLKCAECGTVAEPDANFCLRCGARLRDPDATVAMTPPTTAAASGEADTAPHRTALVACPVCHAPNSPRRSVCGRCGAPMETERTAAGTHPEPDRVAPDRQAARPTPPPTVVRPAPRSAATPTAVTPTRPVRSRRRGVLTAVAAAAALIGGGLGWLAVTELGPFARPSTEPTPVFDPAVYPGAPQQLAVASVTASSTHPPLGENRYDPELMFDGQLATAWNNIGDAAPEGVGETVTIELAEPAWITELRIANGYQKDDERYFGNARPQEIELTFDGGEQLTVVLLDQPGVQAVRIEPPLLTTRVVLRILSAYPGTTYRDVAISELELWGHVALGTDRTLAEQRRGAAPAP